MFIDLYDILIYTVATAVFTAFLTYITIHVAHRLHIIDKPTGGRKIHTKPTALLGGIPIMIGFFIALIIANKHLEAFSAIPFNHIRSIIIASVIVLLGGIIDDKYNANPYTQITSIILASLVVAYDGLGLTFITNPQGGLVDLSTMTLFGVPTTSLLVFGWVLAMTTTTKLLDGLDGLVSGVVMIGGILIATFSLISRYFQPDIALASAVLSGACLGFLVFNKHPARIFLGNVGSIWLGFILAVLAVISGGKIAIALLVLGLPFIDMLLVFARRIKYKKSPMKGDSSHLHFRLMHRIGHKKTVYLYWLIATLFGGLTIIAQSTQKMIAFGILILFAIALTVSLATKKSP